jgi:hypothetical protein
MSVEDVRSDWNTYRLLTKAMFAGINSPRQLEDAMRVIGDFPETRPSEWGEWLRACAFLDALNKAIEVTDVALRSENAFVVAANDVAAKVEVPAPTPEDVAALVTQLGVVNRRIQQDQRFAAALKIGGALADEIGKALKK